MLTLTLPPRALAVRPLLACARAAQHNARTRPNRRSALQPRRWAHYRRATHTTQTRQAALESSSATAIAALSLPISTTAATKLTVSSSPRRRAYPRLRAQPQSRPLPPGSPQSEHTLYLPPSQFSAEEVDRLDGTIRANQSARRETYETVAGWGVSPPTFWRPLGGQGRPAHVVAL